MTIRAACATLIVLLVAALFGCGKTTASGPAADAPPPGQPPPSSSAGVVMADVPTVPPSSSADQGSGDTLATGKRASVTAGAMPPAATFTGVYFSPLFGFLHLVQDKQAVTGRWQRPRKGRWGKLTGQAQGNLLKFEWTEHIDGAVGPNATKSGRGYFVYQRPEGEDVDDILSGEVGFGNDEVGSEWRAIKQRNVKPSPDDIGKTGSPEVGGGDWDSP